MVMKRILLIFAVALLALAACRKETPAVRDAYDLSKLRFEFTIEYPEASKAVKSGWVSGDKVFVFFPTITNNYLTLSYDGSAWSAPALANSTSPTLPATGTLTAVFLPYGNSATASYADSKWTFSAGTDSYFLAAEKVSYLVTDTSDPATAIATLYMAPPTGYAQFFVPHETASGTVRLSCNAVQPAGLASIATDGTVAEVSTIGAQGRWMTGYADTIGDETGYYASGKVVAEPGLVYGFALEYNSSPFYYKNYYKSRTTPIAARGAYQLPAFGNWPDVKNADGLAFVGVEGGLWATLNLGAADPSALGTAFNTVADARTAAAALSRSLPTDAEWNALLADASWLPMTLAGAAGFLVVDSSGATPQYFFLPRGANYWTKDGHYLQVGADTDPTVVAATPSGAAYARVLTSGAGLFDGSFVDPIDGSDI